MCFYNMTEHCEKSENVTEKNKNDVIKTDMPPPSSNKVMKRLRSRDTFKYSCTGCGTSFSQLTKLKYHIRSAHFNFKTKLPNFARKNVKETWFEKVENTNFVVEMKKESNNKVIIRKLESNEAIIIDDASEVRINVSESYPTGLFLVYSFFNITPTELYEIDDLIEKILASKKMSKLADMIAEKTIFLLRNMANHTIANGHTAYKIKDEKQLRRDSNVWPMQEKSLRNLTLKYKYLIKQIIKDKQENVLLKTASLSGEHDDSDDNEESFNITHDNNKSTLQSFSESNSVKSSEYENMIFSEENKSLESKKDNHLGKENSTKVIDIFNMNTQNDLHRKKTGRKEGDKVFVFQSSSDYEEYHEKVDKILQVGEN